ncbi:MAG: ArsR/SmtB family transcription factor [Fimbriimonadales bacterium]
MKQLVAFGKALADPTRVRILNVLRQSEACVCELIDAMAMGQSTLSTHLQTLRIAGLVDTRKHRTWIIYSIEPSAREAVEAIFDHFPPTDERLHIDKERFDQRLGLRVDGCCVLGSGQLSKETKNEPVLV